MDRIPISINSWIYGHRPIEEIARRAAAAGADGIDINGEPSQVDPLRAAAALTDQGLRPFCVNGNYLVEERTLCHPDESVRGAAVDYVKRLVDLAAEAGAPRVVVVPNRIPQDSYLVSRQRDWDTAVRSLREAGEYARGYPVTILVEAVNKYEVTLVRTLEQAIAMAGETGCGNIRVVADTFHMWLEESAGPHNALRRAGADWVRYLHAGDSTREVPGRGCMDWREILMALDDMDFTGAISLEPLVGRLSAQEMRDGVMPAAQFDAELRFGADHLRYLMDRC